MRILIADEIPLVAGGTSSSDYYTGGSGGPYGDGSGYGEGGGGGSGGGFYYWVFTANTPTYYDSTGAIVVTANGYWDYLSFSDGYTGSGGGISSPDPAPVAKDTPCVETTTSGGSLADINNAALAASNAIAAKNDETYEYASIVWEPNGTVGWTAPYTDNLTDEVNWAGSLSQVPDGSVIVGIVHNHPDVSGINDTIPSGAGSENGEDWDAYSQLINWNSTHSASNDLPRGITVDPNMLLYIYSDEDQKTRVYDNTDKNQTSGSCSLQ
jgi:hypothetical protein